MRFDPITLDLPVTEVTRDGVRWYAYRDQLYPSVTTMLSATDEEGRRALQEWRHAVGADTANRITQTAAKRGTQWHTFCEQYVAQHPIAWTLLSDPRDVAYAAFVADTLNTTVQTVWASETRVVSEVYGLAGRLDMAVQLHDGRYAILDFKTGRKAKTGSRLENYALQATFYADALSEHWANGPIDTVIIAQLLPDRILWQETPVALYRDRLRQRIATFAASVNAQLV